MLLAWRLSPPAYADALDGEGNRKSGARWNSPGRGVVYACENLSLCVLETYVHFSPLQRKTIPDFEAVQIAIPDDAGTVRIEMATFERLLADADPQSVCRQIGDDWLSVSRELVLTAPSIVVPEERNVMLNPAHPRMKEVAIVRRRRFQFDSRFVARA
jgi:RES domain-containing protein